MSIDVIDHPGRHPIPGRDHDIDIATNGFGHLLDQLIGHGRYDDVPRPYSKAGQEKT